MPSAADCGSLAENFQALAERLVLWYPKLGALLAKAAITALCSSGHSGLAPYASAPTKAGATNSYLMER